MSSLFDTKLTDMLGCQYPIIQTAMGWVATSQLVTATVKAGAFGFLAAAVMTAEECEAEIKTIKDKTEHPFGVNLHFFQKDADKIIDICIDYNVKAISYGRSPSSKIIERIKGANIKCVPTIGAIKHAPKAIEMGADILVCQGQEGGGHTGYTPTWLLLAGVLDQNLGIPVVACGGFKDGRGLAAALIFGADGIAMGTRFMMSSNSPIPSLTKQAYIESEVTLIPVSKKLDGLPQRMILNQTLNDLEQRSQFGLLIHALSNALKYKKQIKLSFIQMLKIAWQMSHKHKMTFGETIMASNAPIMIQKAMVEGKPEEGILPSGQVAGLINDLPQISEIIESILGDAKEKIDLLSIMKAT